MLEPLVGQKTNTKRNIKINTEINSKRKTKRNIAQENTKGSEEDLHSKKESITFWKQPFVSLMLSKEKDTKEKKQGRDPSINKENGLDPIQKSGQNNYLEEKTWITIKTSLLIQATQNNYKQKIYPKSKNALLSTSNISKKYLNYR